MSRKFAIIQNNIVTNIILSDQLWIEQNNVNAIDITDLIPQPGPNWNYSNGVFSEQVASSTPSKPKWSDANLIPQYHWIDVGPFFDRFGAKALTVTGSTDPQVQGLVTLMLPRKYVDLKRADLPMMLDLLVAKGVITTDDKTMVMNPITSEHERHVKGLVQPL